MVEVLKKELEMSFDDAVQHVKTVCEEEGFSVLLVKSINEIFKKKLGIMDHPSYTTVLACGPQLAKMALEASFDVGLLFPCSFVVYELERKIIVSHISIMKIARELGLASPEAMQPVIKMTGEMVQKAWERF